MNANFISGAVKIQLQFSVGPKIGETSVAENSCIVLYCLRDHSQELWPSVWGVQKHVVMGQELKELVGLRKEYSTNTMAFATTGQLV